VAGIAIGNKNGEGIYGIAPEASGYLAHFDFESVSLRISSVIQRSLEIAETENASVINFSWNIPRTIGSYDRNTVLQSFDSEAEAMMQDGIDEDKKKIFVWSAGNGRVDDNGNVVSDPTEFDSPGLLAGLGVHFPELKGHVLAVVAVDTNGRIAHYSNRCGIAKDFCIAAPGTVRGAPVGDPSTDDPQDSYYNPGFNRGTSVAAPMVSGALLLMRQYYREMLGGTELVSRLLTTAYKGSEDPVSEGVDYSESDIYGQGLLDLDAATSPFGSRRVLTGDDIEGSSLPLAGTRLGVVGGAAGDALSHALHGHELAFLDELDAPFFLPSESLIEVSPPAVDKAPDPFRLVINGERTTKVTGSGWTLLAGIKSQYASERPARITRMSLRMSTVDGSTAFLSLREHPGSLFGPFRESETHMSFDRHNHLVAPWMGFASGGIGVGSATRLPGGGQFGFGFFRGGSMFPGDPSPDGDSNLAAMMETVNSSGSFSFQAGYLREVDAALGIGPKGAMGHASGRTFFAGATLARNLSSNWRSVAAAYLGRTESSVRGRGVVREIGALISSSFGLALQGSDIFTSSDLLDFSLAQPLRIESGFARFSLPAGRTPSGEALHETLETRLEPSGRELDIRASYQRPFGSAVLRVAGGWVKERGHIGAREGEPYGLLELHHTF